jgi:hypothetical protein
MAMRTMSTDRRPQAPDSIVAKLWKVWPLTKGTIVGPSWFSTGQVGSSSLSFLVRRWKSMSMLKIVYRYNNLICRCKERYRDVEFRSNCRDR